MNLRDLKYIIAVDSEKHFAKAADKCFVSQPALSMQIKKLEEELGVEIFERGNEVLTTEVGKKIIAKAHHILQETKMMKEIAENYKNPYAGELRIGAFPTLSPYLFPQIAHKISKKFSQLKLLLIEEKTAELIRQLKAGEIDAAFIAMPILENDFMAEKIFEEQFLLAVPKNHQLAKKKKVSKDDLKGKSLMLLEEGHCLRNQVLEACSTLGAFEKEDFRATSLETLRQMVIAGVGITLMPKIAIGKKDNNISYVEIVNAPKRSIGLYSRKGFVKKDLLSKIVEITKSCF
ncbi:MAG: LysR family transcriptional regulator [Rickettsiales bacterium]|nr:LysR family transcriptional regulator [Rickettsiales bacterium]